MSGAAPGLRIVSRAICLSESDSSYPGLCESYLEPSKPESDPEPWLTIGHIRSRQNWAPSLGPLWAIIFALAMDHTVAARPGFPRALARLWAIMHPVKPDTTLTTSIRVELNTTLATFNMPELNMALTASTDRTPNMALTNFSTVLNARLQAWPYSNNM
ncbi:hypothetical protein HAX54_030192 [Datura stramonium]|uniref:Uncharacterized protein n=1 Tax=Datura stramonium TaxID=4076 RepID=A0ABS8V9M4_DATST|nr:hypothetical protein [Datura stramonium]